MKAVLISAAFAVLAIRCSREDERLKHRNEPSSIGPQSLNAEDVKSMARNPDGGREVDSIDSVDLVDKFLADRYGDLIPRSEDQKNAVLVADEYLAERKIVVAPPRRYLVLKTSSGWDVTVLSLEDLRRAEEKRGRAIHVSLVEAQGHLEGSSIAVR